MLGITLLLTLPAAGPAAAPPVRTTQAPRVREGRSDAVLAWNDLALEAIRTARTPPPAAARHLAILHVAVADAVNTIYQTHRPYRVGLRAVEPIDPDVAVAAAGQRVLAELYPRQASRFDRALDRAVAAAPAGTSRSRGLTLGRYVADRILAWRRDDGADRAGGFRAEPRPGVWRPTPPRRTPAILPAWGEVTPFALTSARSVRIPAPPELASKGYARDLAEVRRLGSRHSTRRSAEETIIAWFWNDEAGTCTPPGHWNQIAQEVALDRKTTLPENARLFALLNVALADAAIVCWDCKYRHKLWRPITAIRAGDDLADDDADDDPTGGRWSPLLTTPAFPTYVSGHSTFSGAAAGVLEGFFGSDEIPFTVGSDDFRGMRREFAGFWQAAREAGRSRIYGGIHFECDNREGLAAGKAIAAEILRTRLLPTDPQAPRPGEAAGATASQRRERP